MTLFINESHVAALIDQGHATMADFIAASPELWNEDIGE